MTGNLAEQLARLARARGWTSRRAFVGAERSFTHGEVHEGAARAAGVFAEAGVAPADRVLIALSDGIELVWAFLGAVRLGAIAVPVNPMLPAQEHDFLLGDAEPSLVVSDGAILDHFAGTQALSGEELARRLGSATPSPAAPVEGSEPAYAQYTSGTTGKPKAALHRHSDPSCYAAAMAGDVLEMAEDDLVLSVSRSFFAYGLGNTVLFPLFHGAAAVLHPVTPNVEVLAELTARHRPTVLFCVPSYYAVLTAAGDPALFSSVRVAVSSGEVLTRALHERVQRFLGIPPLDALGSTEVGQAFVSNRLDRLRPGTCGFALEGYEISVRDPSGAEVGPNEVGLLWVKGPSVLIGYWRRPEATAEAIVDGWLRTGDRASIDEDGFLHHLGRADDVEIVGGINVVPLEIEALLVSHPLVAEAAVAAVRDELGASRLRAFVVPARGHAPSPALERELIDLVRAHHAPYKVPRSVRFLTALPRTATGKLQRFTLRAGWPDAPGTTGTA